jgi:hypothetical protein
MEAKGIDGNSGGRLFHRSPSNAQIGSLPGLGKVAPEGQRCSWRSRFPGTPEVEVIHPQLVCRFQLEDLYTSIFRIRYV